MLKSKPTRLERARFALFFLPPIAAPSATRMHSLLFEISKQGPIGFSLKKSGVQQHF